jgi:methyl-accepting chemotaxis protein
MTNVETINNMNSQVASAAVQQSAVSEEVSVNIIKSMLSLKIQLMELQRPLKRLLILQSKRKT